MDATQTPDFKSLYPRQEFARRDFLVTSLAAGFALAVQPVSAQTITTDTNGLVAGEVKVPVKDGEIPAYRAMPASGGPFATVLVVEEVFGVHEHIKDICRRLAKAKYFAIAPELYARLGDVSKLSNTQEILAVVDRAPDAQVMSDLDATVAYAQSTGKAETSKLAQFHPDQRRIRLRLRFGDELEPASKLGGDLFVSGLGRHEPDASEGENRAELAGPISSDAFRRTRAPPLDDSA